MAVSVDCILWPLFVEHGVGAESRHGSGKAVEVWTMQEATLEKNARRHGAQRIKTCRVVEEISKIPRSVPTISTFDGTLKSRGSEMSATRFRNDSFCIITVSSQLDENCERRVGAKLTFDTDEDREKKATVVPQNVVIQLCEGAPEKIVSRERTRASIDSKRIGIP